ncbi:hypothetical protein DFH06DRAFT_1317117 [Mycena polygramma]|nr:hypothetical protein DFH06DRAFT_1330739 [Mycena polygramma]KAJ7678326.1 hypothetical protein DFH06DRAFT_1317117 [Mycena polygramma]
MARAWLAQYRHFFEGLLLEDEELFDPSFQPSESLEEFLRTRIRPAVYFLQRCTVETGSYHGAHSRIPRPEKEQLRLIMLRLVDTILEVGLDSFSFVCFRIFDISIPPSRIMSDTDSHGPAPAPAPAIPDPRPRLSVTFALPSLHSAAHQAECHLQYPFAARMCPTDDSAAPDNSDDRGDPAPAVTQLTDGEGVERLWRARMVDGEPNETLWGESMVWPVVREMSTGSRHASVSFTQPRPPKCALVNDFPLALQNKKSSVGSDFSTSLHGQ